MVRAILAISIPKHQIPLPTPILSPMVTKSRCVLTMTVLTSFNPRWGSRNLADLGNPSSMELRTTAQRKSEATGVWNGDRMWISQRSHFDRFRSVRP